MLLHHQQEQIREYFDLMDILLNLIYLRKRRKKENKEEFFAKIFIKILPTPVIISGKTRDTPNTNEAASKKKQNKT